MADDIKRDNKGRFLKGAPSPHPTGRPFKLPENPTLPASRRKAIFRVADRIIDVKVGDGRTERMSVFEANLLNLAREGATSNRAASKTFIDFVMRASEVDLTRRLSTRRFIERMDDVEAENVRLRSKLPPGHGVVIQDRPPILAGSDEVYDDGRLSLDGAEPGNPMIPEEEIDT